MIQLVTCPVHGVQDETFVCQHIVQTLLDGVARGFHWSGEGQSARPHAWCSSCNAVLEEAGWEWTREAEEFAHVKLLCGRCYDDAKCLNGF
jgi:hypothetical protein